MLYYADFHLHSKYSRAVSQAMSLEGLVEGARQKGLKILGTGDFSHPAWFNELKTKLIPSESDGLFVLKGFEESGVCFVLTNEVSSIISTPKGVKKVHHLLHCPSLEIVSQINDLFGKKGNLEADGRPTFGNTFPSEIVEIVESVDKKDSFIIPCHAWTPWFGVFGSMSGFDSLKEAYEAKSKSIFAIETGISSDPAMNWRISSLDGITLVSNSDAHSNHPWRLGRECNAFDFPSLPSFRQIRNSIETKKNFAFTVEVNPSYGKYHFDGHRNCSFSCPPDESKKLKGLCPVCRRRLTIGVLNRVEELADRPDGFIPKNAIPFKTVLPLHELVSAFLGSQLYSKKVDELAGKLLALGSELGVLLEIEKEKLLEACGEDRLVDAIMLNRQGKIEVTPGFDGEYGIPRLGNKSVKEKESDVKQKKLGEY
ncbi:MAG TPA: endonuclease Q family protein [Candidatus Norongarragalinales archaeon]|nr:endonuclease Q family protein [Candidatus Norongarragalinales archaeon]